jgi:competence protein ComEA
MQCVCGYYTNPSLFSVVVTRPAARRLPANAKRESRKLVFLLGATPLGVYNRCIMDPAFGAIKPGEPPQPVPPKPAQAAPSLSWPIGVQIAVVLLVTASMFFLLGRWSLGWTPKPPEQFEQGGPALDLNRATKAELRLVPGLGDALSQRVIDHRLRNGPFKSVDDLRQVPGIGPKTLERLRPHFFVAGEEFSVSLDDGDAIPMETKPRAPPREPTKSKKAADLTAAINVNSADQKELQKLPGVGPKISQRILDERAKAAFKSVEDLRRVPGIGPKTLEKLRPYVTIE